MLIKSYICGFAHKFSSFFLETPNKFERFYTILLKANNLHRKHNLLSRGSIIKKSEIDHFSLIGSGWYKRLMTDLKIDIAQANDAEITDTSPSYNWHVKLGLSFSFNILWTGLPKKKFTFFHPQLHSSTCSDASFLTFLMTDT